MGRILWSAQYHVGCTASAMPTALELSARGHELVVVSVPGAERRFLDLGFGFRANRRFPALELGRPGATPVAAAGESAEDTYKRWWRGLVRAQMADTLDLLSEERFDLVLGGGCMMLCGHGFAAEKAGVPWVSYIDFLSDESWRLDPGFVGAWNRWRVSLGLEPEGRPLEESGWYTFSRHLTLILVLRELWWRQPLPAYVRRAGATIWDPAQAVELPPWFESLGRERPAVLVSTSSLWQDDADLVTGTAEGLADADVDVVVTVAAEHQLPALPPNVIVTGYFPHRLLIPRVAAVVCSAGLGTVTRAICERVPVVVVPRTGDGGYVAQAVVASGVGVSLPPAALTATALREAVDLVLSDRRFVTAAGRMAPASTAEVAGATADAVEALM